MGSQLKVIGCGKTVAALTMTVRFIIGSAIMAATSQTIGLRRVLLQVAINSTVGLNIYFNQI